MPLLCPMKFYALNHVHSHVRTAHLKEKCFKCDKCSFTTGYWDLLRNHHQRVHDQGFGTSGFTCESCGYRAVSKRGLSIHRRKAHPEERQCQRLDKSMRSEEYLQNSLVQNRIFQKTPVVLLTRINVRVV